MFEIKRPTTLTDQTHLSDTNVKISGKVKQNHWFPYFRNSARTYQHRHEETLAMSIPIIRMSSEALKLRQIPWCSL